jgi:hypothetical protein
MELFETLGFEWSRDLVPREIPRASRERVAFRFRRMLPEYVWDAGVLEGNPFTFPEVKTLLEGVTVGGRKLSDQEQILNLAESAQYLVDLVQRHQFSLGKSTFCSLQGLVARHEALEWGHFRGEGEETRFTPDVALGERGRFTPLPTEPGATRLNKAFENGVGLLQRDVSNPFERAAAFFLFGALQQFFFDGNKRTSRFMMNGILMSEGIDAISIPAVRAGEFNSRMVDFYTTRNGTDMMAFVVDCHPEIIEIRRLNPGLSAVRDLPNIKYHSVDDSQSPARSGEFAEAARVNEPHNHVLSIDEVQQQAAERWRRNYRDKTANVGARGAQPSVSGELSKEEKRRAQDFDCDLDHGLDP